MIRTNPSIYAISTPSSPANRTSLSKLYLCRGLLALLWAAAFAPVHASLGAAATALLVIYPLIDAISSLVDYRALQRDAERRITAFNATLSTLAAIATGSVAAYGPAAVLAVFGAWAAIAGAAQFALGIRRRGEEFGRQWPMLVSGGLSFLVGITYCIQATGPMPSLAVLSVYATGGGGFFVIQAGLLAWRSRRQRRSRYLVR
ncbi:hypothetical protein SNE35_03345 [Paucibacter sp. R3-3]|uniref:DUF308 domain-containing protein n=1 Tax=Roseateles agri TaxID=3098619 RepID=A0ABU5DCP4_9BURK|nr:DUF308 domain-containing protein [Paucibacter sp. R3-3]MDY0743520.1 hypothetical protein [Paucibacter sp. R3-3]